MYPHAPQCDAFADWTAPSSPTTATSSSARKRILMIFASSKSARGPVSWVVGLGSGWCGTPRTPSAGPASACPGGGGSVERKARRLENKQRVVLIRHSPDFTLHPVFTGVADRAQPVQMRLSALPSAFDQRHHPLRLLPALRRFLKRRECGWYGAGKHGKRWLVAGGEWLVKESRI